MTEKDAQRMSKRIAEVAKLDMKVENGKVIAYRARILLSFKYDA